MIRTGLSCKHMSALCFVSLLARLVVRPMQAPSFDSVQALLLAILLHGVITAVLAWLFLWVQLPTNGAPIVFLATLVCIDVGRQLLETELFYREASYEPFSAVVPIAILLVLALFVAHSGVIATARMGQVVALCVLVGLAVVVVSNIPNFDITMLPFTKAPLQSVLTGAKYEVPVELFLWAVLCQKQPHHYKSGTFCAVVALCVAVSVALYISATLVFGDVGQVQLLQQFASNGSVSVFERVDAVHGAVSLLCSATHIAFGAVFLYEYVLAKHMGACTLLLVCGVLFVAWLPEQSLYGVCIVLWALVVLSSVLAQKGAHS